MNDAPALHFDQQQQLRWQAFCEQARATQSAFDPDSPGARALASAFGFSAFVADNCTRHPQMTLELLASDDLVATYPPDHMAQRLVSLLPTDTDTSDAADLLTQLQAALRRFRRREMVRIAIRDLVGLTDLAGTMADLSTLAATTIDGALGQLYNRQCAINGTPVDGQGRPQRLVVLGMGKLGAGELNFSSDVDLIFAFPAAGDTVGGKKPMTNEIFFTRLGRDLMRVIGETTADGFVFRVDMRLRPFGESGPLVMSFDHMEDYYQSQGREWERYALIKAAVIAGDKPAGARLLKRLRPFVYRRYLDYGVFESLREMKHKITAEVERKGLHDNIKLGSGGIREIEFFGQMFQLIRGGVLPVLQQPAIQTVLATLASEGYVEPAVCRELTAAYRFLRNTEHRLQEAEDRQTHDLPTDPLPRLQLARSMGYPSWTDWLAALEAHRRKVRTHFNSLLESNGDEAEEDQADATGLVENWPLATSNDERSHLLQQAGFPDGTAATALLEDFAAEPATRALSSAGKRRLDRLMPRVLEQVARSKAPQTVLQRMLQLLKRIQQRTSYLSLLIEYPTALTHLIRLVAASPWISAFLSRHPVLLDELLDARTLYTPPGPVHLARALDRQMERVPEDDLEYQIEALCIFRQINTLRVAASDITSVLPLMKVSDHLTWIAEAILARVVDICWHHLVQKHGRPTCTLDGQRCQRGFAVIGYGKLGGIELGYGSDLDLVFLHAADSGETIGGPRPIDNAHFFARLGQRVVHMLSTHTAAGMLYETDMRLRPSGASGLLVSHVNSFATYQQKEAWTWEHQALIRARPITGDRELVQAFATIRHETLCQPRQVANLKKEVREMRERMRAKRLEIDPERMDIKEDVGAMVDIEFIVQYLVLQHAAAHPELSRWTDNVRLLQALAETGIVDDTTAYRLRQAYLIYRAVTHRLNLQERSTHIERRRFRHLQELVRNVWLQTLA